MQTHLLISMRCAVTSQIYWVSECFNTEMSTGHFPIALYSDAPFTTGELNLFPQGESLSLMFTSTQNNVFKDINQRGVINHCSNLCIVQFTWNSHSRKGKPLPHHAGMCVASKIMATRMSAHKPISFNYCFNLVKSFIVLLACQCPLTVTLLN